MNIAIPMNEDQLSPHFSKADTILFVNEEGETISQHTNPALSSNCTGKQSLIDLLINNKTDRVIVRNIGQQFLGKLLTNGITVFKSQTGRKTIKELASQDAQLLPLTEIAQGRPSTNHDASKGRPDCNHDHSSNNKDNCHEKENIGCGHRNQKNNNNQGRGRCCGNK